MSGAAWLAVGVLWALPAGAKEKAPTPVPSYFAQALVRGEGALQVTYYWSRGPSLRVETVAGWRKYVNLVHGDTYYAYDSTAAQGVAIRRSSDAIAQDKDRDRPFGQELQSLLRQGAELVGEKEVAGSPCNLYRLTDRVGRREVCVTQSDLMLPVHSEVFLRATGTRMYTDYVNWLSGLPIPEAFFEPPDNVEFRHFTLEEFLLQTAREGSMTPAPIMLKDLLHGTPQAAKAAAGGD